MNEKIRMHKRLVRNGVSKSVLKRFERELECLAQIDGQGFDPDEAALIVRIVGDIPERVPMAPFEALWAYASDFLSACIMIAVADGRYSVEQARHVSTLASRLGWSAYQLSRIEHDTMVRLEKAGWLRMDPDQLFGMRPE
jgi:streptomycin 6-kinase